MNPSARLSDNKVPLLHLATPCEHTTRLLLEHGGVDVSAQDEDGFTALHMAALHKKHEAASLLLEHKIDVNAHACHRLTPLHCAAYEDNLEVVHLLLNAKADTNVATVSDHLCITPLHIAVQRLAQLLATYDGSDKQAFLSRRLIIKALLTEGAPVDAQDIDGDTPLHLAAQGGSANCVYLLVKHDANVNIENNKKQTPLYCAHSNKHILSVLLENNANVDAVDSNGMTTLHAAAAYDNSNCVQTLIEGKANVHATNAIGATPLHSAAYHNNTDTIETLITNKADVNAKTKNGSTPFQSLLLGSKAIRTLMTAGAHLPDADWWEFMPMRIVTESETIDTV